MASAASRDHLVLENIGPIGKADIALSDFTVLVGPQATGKSLFLQFLKLVLDHSAVVRTLLDYGLEWGSETSGFLDLYLGRGMSSVWKASGAAKSWVSWRGQPVHLDAIAADRQPGKEQEQCLVVPAQRVLAFSSQSWLRPFSDFRAGDPYVIRAFSEHLRVQADAIFDSRTHVWRLNDEAYSLLQDSIFGRFELAVGTTGGQKELVLTGSRSRPLPFMVWSAGQREFVPLLLALIWLLPAAPKNRKQSRDWVIIEEPEMGLHPKAIAAVLYVLLELLERGYRVCLSTHSTHVLDLVWALQVFKQRKAAPEALLDLFDVANNPRQLRFAAKVLEKQVSVYYFDADTRETRDISTLDPNDPDTNVNSWGGMTEFTSHVGESIAKQVAGDGEE